jgi:hypothetical protein
VPAVDGVQLNDVDVLLHPDGSPDHAYVYGGTPPVAPAEIVVACLTSTGFGLADGDTVSATNGVTGEPAVL